MTQMLDKPDIAGAAQPSGSAAKASKNSPSSSPSQTPPFETEVTLHTKRGGPLSKTIELVNGKPKSDGSACRMVRGKMQRICTTSHQDFGDWIEKTDTNQAWSLGQMRPGLGQEEIVGTKKNLKPGEFARTKDNIVYAARPSYILIDFDTKGMPADIKAKIDEAGGLLAVLRLVVPAIETAGYVRRPSTSAKLYNLTTKEEYSGGNEHVFLAVNDGSDGDRFLTTFHQRAWLKGFGWHVISGSGSFLERSIIDVAVRSPERLVFEGPPITIKPLAQHERKATVHDGAPLNSRDVLDLTSAEKIELDAAILGSQLALEPQRKIVRAAWEKGHVDRLVSRGETKEAAQKTVTEWSEGGEIGPGFELYFDEFGAVDAGEVAANYPTYINKTLADPFEGAGSSPNKAVVLRKGLTIFSHSHGGTYYKLTPPPLPDEPVADSEPEEPEEVVVEGSPTTIASIIAAIKWGKPCDAYGTACAMIVNMENLNDPTALAAIIKAVRDRSPELTKGNVTTALNRALAAARKKRVGEVNRIAEREAVALKKRSEEAKLEAKRKASISDKATDIGKSPMMTDLGNAHRLINRYHNDIRYVHAYEAWFVWDGTRWKRDEGGTIKRLAHATVESIWDEAAALTDDEKRKAMRIHAMKSQSAGSINAMVSVAQALSEVELHYSKLDADPMLTGVLNGVIELETGTFREGRREDYITKRANVIYDPNAKCPQWLRFQLKIANGDKALVRYKQRLFGFCLTGKVNEVLVIAHGSGNNGKTVEGETIHEMLGDYAIAMNAALLVAPNNTGGATPDIVALKSKRLCSINETNDQDYLNEGRVKYLTSKDTIEGRALYEAPINFKPTHKNFMRTNHKPTIRGTDAGIWRRIHYIPYTYVVKPKEKREDFREAILMPEASGILNWQLAGLAQCKTGDLKPPSVVCERTQTYRNDMDVVGQWVDLCVEKSVEKVKLSVLYPSFKMWIESEQGWKKAPANKRLSESLTARGYEKSVIGGAAWFDAKESRF